MELVYAIRNSKNNMLYVGRTRTSLHSRWFGHVSLLRNGRHTSSELQNDFDCFGEGAFRIELIEKVDENSAKEIEIYWIIWAYKKGRCYNSRIPITEWMKYVRDAEFAGVEGYWTKS